MIILVKDNDACRVKFLKYDPFQAGCYFPHFLSTSRIEQPNVLHTKSHSADVRCCWISFPGEGTTARTSWTSNANTDFAEIGSYLSRVSYASGVGGGMGS